MKKYSLLFLLSLGIFTLSAQREGVTYTKAHQSNYRTWSIGLNGGTSMMFGDLISYSGQKEPGIPSGVGGFELGVSGHLTKFFNPTIGVRGTASYMSLSGVRAKYYFEGDLAEASAAFMFNLSNLVIRGKIKQRRNALLLGVGLGITYSKSYLYNADSVGVVIGESGLVDYAGQGDGGWAAQAHLPLTFEYKRKLNNSWELDAGFRYSVLFKDYFDVFEADVKADNHGYGYIGVTYNFGPAEKQSIIWSNPLDDMFAEVEEVKNNFDKLTTDDDGDGVNNFFDKESNTPEGVIVDGSGTAVDADQDGIPDYMDEDPFTGKGAQVDSKGRAVDTDNDGVPDYMDKEPGTAKGQIVNFQGKAIVGGTGAGGVGGAYLPSVYFPFNSANVSAANQERLATVAMVMKKNENVRLTVVGHADSRGSEEYNKNLARRRAEATIKQLSQVYGIDESRFTIESEGESDPLAQSRHDVNRRVDFIMK